MPNIAQSHLQVQDSALLASHIKPCLFYMDTSNITDNTASMSQKVIKDLQNF